ncbi:hypothetical protein NT6N_27870 [Oceaniferula spumae]|uniref:Uncharacterized protein n=1 Tax=Oceaniferula spumae TaxID=2979115 RepID=A0AAT9FNP6_9BACT
MIKRITSITFLVLGIASFATFTACEKKGPAEKAGEKIDKAVDDAGDKVEDATDN